LGIITVSKFGYIHIVFVVTIKEGNNDKTKSSAPKKEGEAQKFDGEPKIARPSDEGGTGDGSPASGTGTTLSNKGMTKKQWDKFLKTLEE
jgi:hypothetical protein